MGRIFDDLPFLDLEGMPERNIGIGTKPRELAELNDCGVGLHAFAGVLVQFNNDTIERSDDRVLLEDLSCQRELGLSDLLIFRGLQNLGVSDLELALGLGHFLLRDHSRLLLVEPLVDGHDGNRDIESRFTFFDRPSLSAWILFLATVSSATSRCR